MVLKITDSTHFRISSAEIAYYFPTRLRFVVCISYSLVSMNMLMLDVVIHQNFPAETVQIVFCKMTTLNSLWFNKQSSEAASFHDCTILHYPESSPDEECGEGRPAALSDADIDEILWKLFSFHYSSSFGQTAGCGSVAPLSIGVFLPAGWDLPPFEDQFTFWWVSEYWFQKGILFLCTYTFAVRKGSLLLAVAWKTVWGSSTTDITGTTAGLWQGNGDTWAHSHQPTPMGMWRQSPTAAIQPRGERRVSCLQVADQRLAAGKPAPRSRGEEGPKQAGSNLFFVTLEISYGRSYISLLSPSCPWRSLWSWRQRPESCPQQLTAELKPSQQAPRTQI